MNRLYQTVITYVSAHRIDQRAHHEIDRANQRLVIVGMVLIAAVWYGFSADDHNPVVGALLFVAAVYATLTLI